MASTIVLTAKAHWINACVVYLFSQPVLILDGVEKTLRWREPINFSVTDGPHELSVGIRYLKTSRVLGNQNFATGNLRSDTVHLMARNGPLNSDGFQIEYC